MKLVRLCFRSLIFLLLFIFLISFPYAIAREQQPSYAYIIDVNHPPSVNAKATFYVSVTVEYWVVTGTTGPYTDFLVSINEADNRTTGSEYLNQDLARVRDQLRQGKGTKTYDFTLTAPKAGKIWPLVAETYIWGVPHRGLRLFDKRNFNITILKTPAPLPTGPDILVNGGFESDFNGWERYGYGDGVANLSTIVVHQGNYSLATSSRLSPTRPDRPNGGGVYQVIERPDLSFDMNFSFWVYPMYVIRESTTDVRAWIVFHTNEEVFKIYYCISWHDKSALRNGSDVTFFLLEDCGLGVWNFIERNLKSDFEAGFGSSSQYRLLKIEVYLDLALHFFSMLCPFAYWDDISLVGKYVTETSTPTPTKTFETTTSEITTTQGHTTPIMPAPTSPPEVIFWIVALAAVVAISTAALVYVSETRRRAYPSKPATLRSLAQRPPATKEGLMSLDDKVYAYISDRGGEISWSQACRDLGISIDELKASIDRLKKAGRIE